MTKTFTLAVAMTFALSMAAAAQSTQPQTQPSQRSENTVTLTGCVAPGATPDTFVLTNITPSPAMKGAAGQQATGTSGTMNEWKDVRLELKPSSSVELKNHLGHKVEVKGTLQPSMAGGEPSHTGTSGAAGSAMKQHENELLRVTSLRHLSDTCSGQ